MNRRELFKKALLAPVVVALGCKDDHAKPKPSPAKAISGKVGDRFLYTYLLPSDAILVADPRYMRLVSGYQGEVKAQYIQEKVFKLKTNELLNPVSVDLNV